MTDEVSSAARLDQGGAGPTAAGVPGLLAGLRIEIGLLRDLQAGLLEQRKALARDDAGELERVVHHVGRTLLALREIRRERARLVEGVTGDADSNLAAVVQLLAITEAETCRAAVDELHLAAQAAQRELEVNQRVIRKAIETGEQFLHQMLTASAGTEPGVGYPAAAAQGGSGLLLNQRA